MKFDIYILYQLWTPRFFFFIVKLISSQLDMIEHKGHVR